jgi:hypothetical protein
MNVRTDGDHMRTTADPQQPPRPSEFPSTDEPAQRHDLDMVDASEAIEGDGPVLEEIDTSGVARTLYSARPTEAGDVDSLFGRDAADDFRAHWDIVQRSFVDDPQQAVRDGDELVMQVIEALRQTFAAQKTELEKGINPDATETLRLALRRYRSFFERLLTI